MSTLDPIRTGDPQLRKLMRYPLRHEGSDRTGDKTARCQPRCRSPRKRGLETRGKSQIPESDGGCRSGRFTGD